MAQNPIEESGTVEETTVVALTDDDLLDKTVQGEGAPIAPTLAPEAKAAQEMHSRIEEAKKHLQLGLSTFFLLDATRDEHFKKALSLLNNIATE